MVLAREKMRVRHLGRRTGTETVQSNESHPVVIYFPHLRGHLGRDVTGIWWVEARDSLKQPMVLRTGPTTKDSPAQMSVGLR